VLQFCESCNQNFGYGSPADSDFLSRQRNGTPVFPNQHQPVRKLENTAHLSYVSLKSISCGCSVDVVTRFDKIKKKRIYKFSAWERQTFELDRNPGLE